MNADDIRALACRTVRDALAADHKAKTYGCHPECETLRELDGATALAIDALAAAGLLPTIHQTRVHPLDPCDCGTCEAIALAHGSVRQEQYTTEWREIPTPSEGDRK